MLSIGATVNGFDEVVDFLIMFPRRRQLLQTLQENRYFGSGAIRDVSYEHYDRSNNSKLGKVFRPPTLLRLRELLSSTGLSTYRGP